jgi:uncharacterized protein
MADTIVGVISDTHGLLRPQALAALRGVDLIVHAGDVGDGDILGPLRAIAPTFAVRGNVDIGPWGADLPPWAIVAAGGQRLYVLHDIGELDVDPRRDGFAAVIYGHSHQPSAKTRDGVLYLNPGSAGPRRFRLPVAVARLVVSSDAVRADIVELAIAP